MTLTERTTAALAWLDVQLAICNAATEGPWHKDSARGVMALNGGPICYPIGTPEVEEKDATFIAAARTGYPAMLEGMKVATKALSAFLGGLTPVVERNYAELELDSILTKIEQLQ